MISDQKMNNSKVHRSKISLLFVISMFVFSTLLVSLSPKAHGQAELKPGESKSIAAKVANVDLKNTDTCKSSLATNDLATAKAYSKERLDKRLNSTKVIEKSVNETYSGINDTYTSKISSIQSIINKYAKGSKAKADKEDLDKAKSKLLKQTGEKKKIIEKGIEGAQSGQTPQVVANFTCDAIFQGAVYSKLVPSVRAQLKLDAIKMRNSLNQGRYTAINALYKENSGTLKGEKSGIDKLDNPKSYNDEIKALQSRIDAGENVVNDVTSFGAKPKKSAPEITKQLSELTAKLREEKRANSSTTDSGSTQSSGSSGSNTSNQGKVIEKVTKRNSEGKVVSGRYCHPHGSDTKHSCVSYGEGKKNTTRKQAVDRARSKAKKHDDDYADSRTISARNPSADNSNSKNSVNSNLKAVAAQKRAERKAAEKRRAERAKAEKKQKQAEAKRMQQQARDRRQYQKEQEQKRQKEKKQYEKDTKKVI